MTSFLDLDIERKTEIVVLTKIATILANKLHQISGIEATVWLDQTREQAQDEESVLLTTEVHERIEEIENALQNDEGIGISSYLMNVVRGKSHA